MIEEMKKEIEVNIRYFDKEFYDLYNEFCDCAGNGYPQNGRIPIITINKVFEILDKYKDKEDKYKTMWEELYSEREKPCSIEYMQDLEEKEIPINLMIDAVFNNFNDDTELMARWLFKNGYINKNKDGNYIINKKYKPTFFTTKEIKEYDYAFRYLQQENTQLKQQLKDKDEKISKAIEYLIF